MRIVLIQPNLLGDVIVLTPLMRQIRAARPEARLTVVLGYRNRDVAPLLGNLVDDVLDYVPRVSPLLKLTWRARRARFDWLIDVVEVRLRASALLVRLIGAKQSAGFANGHDGLYDHTVPLVPRKSAHIVDRSLKVLEPLGIPLPAEPRIELHLPQWAADFADQHWPDASRPTVLVNVSGTGSVKQWGGERYVQWIQSVRRSHPQLQFAVTGHKNELEVMKEVAQGGEATLLPITPQFAQFAAYVRKADYLLTPETSALHLAAAWQRPCLGLFVQREYGDNWMPYHSPHVCVLSPTIRVADIPLAQAISGFEQLLNENPAQARRIAHA